VKKILFLVAVTLLPIANASADTCVLLACLPSAPEIDGAAGALAIGLVGGGVALLKRARRKQS
jgi:hypothetical protein